jgi:4-hydroxybenzoate polyprenyltransferase
VGAPDRAVAGVQARTRPALALAVALRPAQWTKNAVVLAPVFFALRAGEWASLSRALLATLIFCALASAAYLANDVVDRERDRRHPLKRLRPIAAGEVPVATAVACAAALALGALGAAAALGIAILGWAVAYLALQALYSHVLRGVPILDVFAIAAGFVVRVLLGAAAVGVPVSGWLYLCTLLLALFLALEKRRAEIALLASDAAAHRAILSEYSIPFLDQLVTVTCACTVLAYALYTVAPDTVAKFGGDRLKYSIPFVLYGLFRYLWLVHRRGEGGQPERLLLRDRPLQLGIAAWLAAVGWAIYAGR